MKYTQVFFVALSYVAHQYLFVKVTHLSTVSYRISTKIPIKTSTVESFLGKSPDLTRSFRCYLEQLFCGEQVSTYFC